MANSAWPKGFYGEKMSSMSSDMQGSFLKLMDEMYEQESRDMIRFIEESRRQLRSIGFDIQSEQDALHRTSMKLSESRMSAESSMSSRSNSFVRQGSSGSKSPCSSSLDSVTFESEKSTLSTRSRPRSSSKEPQLLGVDQHRPPSRSPRVNRTKVQPLPQGHDPQLPGTSPRPFPMGKQPDDEDYDSDKEYQEEKEKIMRQVTGATQTLERERTRQALITQQKKEKKKAKAVETVSQMVREASAVEMKKEEDRKRQDEIVKQKLEQKKLRQREKTDLFEMSLCGSATARPASELSNKDAHGLGTLSARPKTAASPLAEVETPINRAAMDAQLKGEKAQVSPRRQEDVPTAWGMDNNGIERQMTETSYWEEDRNKDELVIDGDDGHEIKQEKKKKKKKKDKLTRQAASLEPAM